MKRLLSYLKFLEITYLSTLGLVGTILGWIVALLFLSVPFYCAIVYVPETLGKMQDNNFKEIQWFPTVIGIFIYACLFISIIETIDALTKNRCLRG